MTEKKTFEIEKIIARCRQILSDIYYYRSGAIHTYDDEKRAYYKQVITGLEKELKEKSEDFHRLMEEH